MPGPVPSPTYHTVFHRLSTCIRKYHLTFLVEKMGSLRVNQNVQTRVYSASHKLGGWKLTARAWLMTVPGAGWALGVSHFMHSSLCP